MKLVRISALWCSSCLITYPIWEKIKKENPNIEYQELDYDIDDISFFHVGELLPVIIAIKDGKEVSRIVGEKKEQEIQKWMEEFI